MRVAAVAFVLIVGAAVVLAFANTLNSWVLGGLLGGLAAILLCIPISLAIFTLLARRHEARQRTTAQALAAEEEADYVDEGYENEVMVYEAEGYAMPFDEAAFPDMRTHVSSASPRSPVSGYLALPSPDEDLDYYADDDAELVARQDPRNYPRQPRYPVRSLARDDENAPLSHTPSTGSTRRPATRSLAQHQSLALRQARQEAQRQRLAQKRGGTNAPSRHAQRGRSGAAQRPRTSRDLRSASYQSEDEYESRYSHLPPARSSWDEERDYSASFSTEELREYYQQYPRQAAYPRNPRSAHPHPSDPWTDELEGVSRLEEELRPRRPRRDPERLSGNLRNPLVRRAPYLYDDDPLNEEFARQLEDNQPITRRSRRYHDEED